ncbi:MAG: hypothetical protein QXY39_03770 [Thermofilaceae archaeon]
MPSDYSGTIHLKDNNKMMIISSFCRDNKRRVSIRTDTDIVFMDIWEVISLIRELTIAISKPCFENKNQDNMSKNWKSFESKNMMKSNIKNEQKSNDKPVKVV